MFVARKRALSSLTAHVHLGDGEPFLLVVVDLTYAKQ